MYSPFQLAKKYFEYYLKASNGKGHGVHSPFVFNFITNVLNDKKHYDCYKNIEALRNNLKRDETVLIIEDFGAGSRVNAQQQRKVSAIANSALKPKKFGQLLYRIAQHYKPENILELGTSLGITTSYLATGNPKAKLITMEGAAAVANVARKNFMELGLQNISIIEGNFDNTLSATIQQLKKVDLAFIDGNHREEPTINYYHQLLNVINDHSILIFDDIHWSKEMEAAWQHIKDDEAVTLTIDLFFIGLVFFRKENKVKQHFSIRF